VKTDAKHRKSPDARAWDSVDYARSCAKGEGVAVKSSRVRIVSPDIGCPQTLPDIAYLETPLRTNNRGASLILPVRATRPV
jgi:hypothetical protein